MAIKSAPPLVYDTLASHSHTGDLLWSTALTVTGKGKASVNFSANATNALLQITIDGNVIYSQKPGSGSMNMLPALTVEWNISCLVEIQCAIAGNIVYAEILYYNR